MGSPLLGVPWESCSLAFAPDPALDAEARRLFGVVPAWTGYFSSNPWLVRALLEFTVAEERRQRLSPLLAGQLSLVVSQENSCRYCYAVVRLMLRLRGLSEAHVQALETQLSRALPDARTDAAICFARRMSRSAPLVGTEDLAALRQAGFDSGEIRELAFVVAVNVFANRAVTVPAIPPQKMEQMPQRWFFRFMRPLMHRMMDAHTRRLRAATPPAAAAPLDGPFAGLVRSLAGSELAAVIAQAVNDMWASPALPRRAKLLMIAVIARALDCGRTTEEATAALRTEGLDRLAVDEALAHLRGSSLTELEHRLLGFARETVWYQTAQVQRQAHALSQALPREQFVEAVGVSALANALCRFRAAVEHGPVSRHPIAALPPINAPD